MDQSLFDFFEKPDPESEIQSRMPETEITLRPYQADAVDSVYREWEQNTSTLVCLPTGTGKSVVFSEVMRRWIAQ